MIIYREYHDEKNYVRVYVPGSGEPLRADLMIHKNCKLVERELFELTQYPIEIHEYQTRRLGDTDQAQLEKRVDVILASLREK